MSKFDRGVFIFIGLGIWALAMSQIFAPKIADAGLSAIQPIKSIVTVSVLIGLKIKLLNLVQQVELPQKYVFIN